MRPRLHVLKTLTWIVFTAGCVTDGLAETIETDICVYGATASGSCRAARNEGDVQKHGSRLHRLSNPSSTDAPAPTVVCFGDSITNRGYPKELAELLGANVYNAGVAGHTTRHALKRLKTDVLNVRPDIVVISFGTNDSRLAEERVHVPLEKYEANLNTIVQTCKGANIQPLLCTVPPIDATLYFTRHAPEKFEQAGGLAKVLENYRSAVLRVAKQHEIPVVDLNRSLATSSDWRDKDGVHPSRKGNRIIAELVAEQIRTLMPPQS